MVGSAVRLLSEPCEFSFCHEGNCLLLLLDDLSLSCLGCRDNIGFTVDARALRDFHLFHEPSFISFLNRSLCSYYM